MKWTLACSRSGVTLLLALSCSASSSINTPTDIDREMSWGVRKRRREYFKIKWHETILVYRICMHQCCVVCTVSQTKSSTFNSSNYKRKRWMKFHISKWRKKKKKTKQPNAVEIRVLGSWLVCVKRLHSFSPRCNSHIHTYTHKQLQTRMHTAQVSVVWNSTRQTLENRCSKMKFEIRFVRIK